MARRPQDPVALVAGLAIAAFGAVLLLDRLDVVDLRFAALAPLVCALLGAILLATGLTRRD
jgi:hypothetical protein